MHRSKPCRRLLVLGVMGGAATKERRGKEEGIGLLGQRCKPALSAGYPRQLVHDACQRHATRPSTRLKVSGRFAEALTPPEQNGEVSTASRALCRTPFR